MSSTAEHNHGIAYICARNERALTRCGMMSSSLLLSVYIVHIDPTGVLACVCRAPEAPRVLAVSTHVS